MFTPIADHVQQGIDRLLQQYANSPNLQGVLTAIINPIQDIESALTDMNTLRYLPNAQGAQLDVIGIIVGLARVAGQSDASYITALYGQIIVNVSQGDPEGLISAFHVFTGSTFTLIYEGICTLIFQSPWIPPDQDTVNAVLSRLQEAASAGIFVESIVSFDATNAFAYDGILPGGGYDDGTQTVGGKYAGQYERA